jgi:hypothetical protein
LPAKNAAFPIAIIDIIESGLIVGASNDQTGSHTWTVDGNHVTGQRRA